jgi:hypothetical protein
MLQIGLAFSYASLTPPLDSTLYAHTQQLSHTSSHAVCLGVHGATKTHKDTDNFLITVGA